MRPIPKIVFDHFRNPQNKEIVDGAQGIGEVAGRGKGSTLQLFLLFDEDGVIKKAGFQSKCDRASDAPLSLTTTLITGKTLAEVESLTLEDIGAAFGLHREQLPMLGPAHEALQAALANYKGLPSPYQFEGGLVCTCLNVREGRIRRTIKKRCLKTVEEVAFWTRACTGCRSCRPDIRRLLGG